MHQSVTYQEKSQNHRLNGFRDYADFDSLHLFKIHEIQ